MSTIVTRAGKGSPLTNNEVDANFVNLNTDKVEKAGTDSVSITVNSASDALRITQTGAGNALLVEDSANPDSTPTIIDASGNVGIGITPAFSSTKLSMAGAGSDAATWGFRYSADGFGYENLFIKSRGTGLFSPAIVQSGDQLGNIRFAGWDGAAYTGAASIVALVDGTPGTNDMPGRLMFATTPDGSATPVERMRIDSAGRVGIGGTATTGEMLAIRNTAETTATVFGLRNLLNVNQATTTTVYGISDQTQILSPAALTNLFRFRAASGGFTGTVTNQYGYAADSTLTGATNNYGFHSNIASGTGRWNFYAAGTATNYFEGSVGVGIAAPVSKLDVYAASGYVDARVRSGTNQTYVAADGSASYFGTYNSIPIIFSTGNITQFRIAHVASAVNYLQVTGGATGNGATLSAQGSDTNIGITITPKGTGVVTTTAQTTLSGSSSNAALKVPNIKEVITVSATAATGTIAYDITTQSVLYYTSAATANWTVNFRGSSGTSLNTIMATGESMSATFIVTQGATAYFNNTIQVDGVAVTPKWQGGAAPTAGNANSVDCYTYAIVKTGSAAFTILASVTKFV